MLCMMCMMCMMCITCLMCMLYDVYHVYDVYDVYDVCDVYDVSVQLTGAIQEAERIGCRRLDHLLFCVYQVYHVCVKSVCMF